MITILYLMNSIIMGSHELMWTYYLPVYKGQPNSSNKLNRLIKNPN